MSPHRVGYARISTNQQDLSTQQARLKPLGVPGSLVYVARGLTGRKCERPRLQQPLAACHAGDSLVDIQLNRLTRSQPDAYDIVESLTKRNIKLSLDGTNHDPFGKLLFNALSMAAEFESDLIQTRTSEGVQIARAKGKFRGKQSKLSPTPEKHLVAFHHGEQHTSAEIADLSGIALSTVYRIVQRTPDEPGKAGPQVQGPIQNNELPA
ncbi:recombinase family protein [Glutamicibacter sp. NPDC087344]|uniref:recombinase family protein n=1 Tax=Glutamicibacter sp. NPDC087344 TaxID=3363994 RepID=UPI003803EDA6